MQVLIVDNVIKIHCSLSVVVRLLHPQYSASQIDYIGPYIQKAIRTRNGLSINGYTIKGGKYGWYFITKNTVQKQLYSLMDALFADISVRFQN